MKHLLKHLQNQIRGRLGDLHNGGNVSDKKLEIIYEDLLNKVDQALEELTESGSFSVDVNLDHLNFDQSHRDPSNDVAGGIYPGGGIMASDQTSEQERTDEDPVENDEHHAWQDGGEESFEDLKENVENFTATDLDPDRLRELANVAEQFDGDSSSVDPLDMSDDEFGKILSRLQPNLIDWATGKKENLVKSLDQTEIASEIQNALQRAQQESDGNIDMLRSFQKYVKDSIFDTSRNIGEKPETPSDITEGEETVENKQNIRPNDIHPKNTYEPIQ